MKNQIINFTNYRFLLFDLVIRDIKVKYRRSILGLLWSVLNPLLMMIVITAVFANIFRFDMTSFPIFYLTGSVIFSFISEATSSSLASIVGAASLIKKVYIPKYIFVIEKCIFAFVNLLFSLIAVVIMVFILGHNLSLSVLLFPVPLILALIFSTGLGLILATLNVFFRDIGHLYSVWITAWMYLTPIIYPVDILPSNVLVLMNFNPLYFYVTYFRTIVIDGSVPSAYINFMSLMYAVVFFIVGVVVFKKNQDRFILFI